MPFIAEFLGERVNSLSISPDQFMSLRGKELICDVCNSPMHTRYSKAPYKVPHFVHTANTNKCFTSNMSREHLAIQALIEAAINDISEWEAKVEYVESNWRGDVVAINKNDGSMISFEVQLSGMTAETMEERTRRHLESGVNRIIWICGKDFGWLDDVPSVLVDIDTNWNPLEGLEVKYKTLPDFKEWYWSWVDTSDNLDDFVRAILGKQLFARHGSLGYLYDTNEGTRRPTKMRLMSGMDSWHFQTRHEVVNETYSKAWRRMNKSLEMNRFIEAIHPVVFL